jgi:hypothetical protein
MNQVVFVKSGPMSPVGQLLTALEAKCAASTFEDLLSGKRAAASTLILSEAEFVAACKAADSLNTTPIGLLSQFEGVLIYPFSGTAEGLGALESVVEARVSVGEMSADSETDYVVHGNREMCGPFSDLRIPAVRCKNDVALKVREAQCPVDFIVTSDQGSLFTRFELSGVDLFVASSTAVFDASVQYDKNLNVQECFSALAPLMFFLRHSRIGLPQSPLRWANWIIDDPNLTPRYGFLNIKELAQCIRETGAAASIAFIPWNHSRTDRKIVGLFRDNWPKLSICIHGCDHTGSEFSTRTMLEALPLVDLATNRMHRLQSETSLGFERVMVFPQGRFSGEAMRALRASEMLAAVNTELVDCRTGAGVNGHELLRPAITSFGGFPLFMRRRAEEHAANFALDLLLGKPCLIVTHHQYFANGLKPLQSVVASLNALDPEMVWTNLEHGISSTYSVNQMSVRLYSAQTNVRPWTKEKLLFTKAETDPQSVHILVDNQRISYRHRNGELQFTLQPPEKADITVAAPASVGAARPAIKQSPKYRFKVTARRYLTEVRDNYLYRFPTLSAGASSVQKLLHR